MPHRTSLFPWLLSSLLIASGLSLPLLAERPKFAVVNVTQAFEAYHLSVEEHARTRAAREELKKDKRLERIKLTRVELLDLRNNVRDATLPEAQRQEYFRKFQMKAHELRSLQRDTIHHLDEQNKTIDEAMVKKTRVLLEAVRAVVQNLGEEGGYDYVFEMGGKTSSQIAPLIYIRHATDLTELVIETLNKDAPAKKAVATTGPLSAETP